MFIIKNIIAIALAALISFATGLFVVWFSGYFLDTYYDDLGGLYAIGTAVICFISYLILALILLIVFKFGEVKGRKFLQKDLLIVHGLAITLSVIIATTFFILILFEII